MKIKSKIKGYILSKTRTFLEKQGLALCDKNSEGLVSSLNYKYGYALSNLHQRPIDIENQELPWFTYPAIEYVSQFNLQDKSIFEWGSGYSSLFFARRCKNIISIESNQNWYKELSQKSLGNQKIFLKSEESFARSINDFSEEFDIIIIDSLRRYDCALNAISCLKKGGIIILDNSDWFPNTCKFLRQLHQFIQVDFHGFGPINPYSWTTSFFIDREISLNPLGDIQPHYSKAAIIQVNQHDKTF